MTISDQQYKKILAAEGRYANLKGDTGGETYCGISYNNHPQWPGWQRIKAAKQAGDDLSGDDLFNELNDSVRHFYDEYISSVLANQIFSPGAFMPILDSGVTGGRGAAAWVIQSICRHEGIPTDVDGAWGPGSRRSVEELNARLNANGELIGDKMALRVFAEQIRRYLVVADSKAQGASQEERSIQFGHLRSWLRRSLELLED